MKNISMSFNYHFEVPCVRWPRDCWLINMTSNEAILVENKDSKYPTIGAQRAYVKIENNKLFLNYQREFSDNNNNWNEAGRQRNRRGFK